MSAPPPPAAAQIASGERFAFGENWAAFLASVDAASVERARAHLRETLETVSLEGTSFLDVGSGSGLTSLAARSLGARVHSFDFDPASVACARALKDRFRPGDDGWTIGQGSALDEEYLSRLGLFDTVCSWGVLHHTGRMWRAMENLVPLVAEGGRLHLALYNDQGWKSAVWARIKRAYCASGRTGRALLLALCLARLWGPTVVRDLLLRGAPLRSWRAYGAGGRGADRGMSAWRDVVDWVGGHPFEVARPDEVFTFFKRRGFRLEFLRTAGSGHGCNEFVFRRG